MTKKFTLSFLLLLSILLVKNINAQELRLYGGVQVYGSVNGAFTGPGIGFENSIARHFTLNADLNAGFSSTGSAIEFKPAVQYYFKPQNRGFYIGPSFKYIRLNEKGNNEEYVDDLYSIGFNVGIKTEFKSKYVFLFNASPHATIGGAAPESQVAGMSVQAGIGIKL